MRSFICAFVTSVTVILLLSPPVRGQSAAPREIPRFNFDACNIAEGTVPTIYYLDLEPDDAGRPKKTFKEINIPRGGRGGKVKIPLIEPVQLYTGRYDQDGKPQMTSFATLPVKSPSDSILMLVRNDAEGKQQINYISDSVERHPAGTVRLLNLAKNAMAASFGGAPQLVRPGGEMIAKPSLNDRGRFMFRYTLEQPGAPAYVSPTRNLRFRSPTQRLLVVHTEIAVEQGTDKLGPEGLEKTTTIYQPTAYLLFDAVAE